MTVCETDMQQLLRLVSMSKYVTATIGANPMQAHIEPRRTSAAAVLIRKAETKLKRFEPQPRNLHYTRKMHAAESLSPVPCQGAPRYVATYSSYRGC